MKYQEHTNYTGKPVEWFVDIETKIIEATTAEEAEKIVQRMIQDRDINICQVSLVEGQEVNNGNRSIC